MTPRATFRRGRVPTTAHRHICVVTETYAPEVNGVALSLAQLVRHLRTEGRAVSLVHPRQRAADAASSHAESSTTTVTGVPLPFYKGLQLGLPAGLRLRQLWTTSRPDVVYVATEGPLGLSAVRTAQRLGIPVFSGFHTNFHEYTRHYRAAWLGRTLFRYLRWFHNQTAGTLVATHDLQTRLESQGIEHVSVLGRGVDSALFTPARRSTRLRHAWGASDGVQVALYVGRVAPEKNVELAIAAYRAMQQVTRAVRLVIVGDGPSRAALQRQHPDVVFTGIRSGEPLAAHYASADVFLFPSETDTFGNVVLEAMASGLTVVAYNYAAAQAHISPGETGVLAPLGDRAAFIAAAVRVAKRPRAHLVVRHRARMHALSLDWQHVAQNFARVLLGPCPGDTLNPAGTVFRPRAVESAARVALRFVRRT